MNLLLTGGNGRRSGRQPAAGLRGSARRHRRSEGTALRARSLTSHVGDKLWDRCQQEVLVEVLLSLIWGFFPADIHLTGALDL